MPKKLLEAGFLAVDLPSIMRRAQVNSNVEANTETPNNTNVTTAASGHDAPTTPAQTPEEWLKWGAVLEKRLEDNNKASSAARYSEYEIESKFFKEFFTVNWGETTAKKLDLIGEPLKKALRVLKFDPTKNPILGFIQPQKDFVVKLINSDKLNTSTFKAIYNAVAKRLVAESEFIRNILDKEYNIIYCPDLYNKTVAEIEEYLKLQNEILKTSVSSYTVDDQITNRKVFLKTNSISELEPKKRATAIKAQALPRDIYSASKAMLNSLSLAEQIRDTVEGVEKTALDSAGQDELVNSFNGDVAKVFATLVSLSLNANSRAAKQALSNSIFSRLSAQQLAEATIWLAANNAVIKGQLQTSDADSLVAKLLNAVAKK